MQVNTKYFLSQPHQPFFLLSIVNAVIFMGLFVLGYKGVIVLEFTPLFLHVYSFIYGVFFLAFSGFLFTTFPRFNQTEVIQKEYYIRVFFLSLLASILLYMGVFFGKYIFLAGMFLLLLAEALMVYKLYMIYTTSRVADKSDSFWILGGNFFGLFAHILFIVYMFGVDDLFGIALSLSVFMFVLFTAFSIAQRMIPFFSHSFATKNTRFVPVSFVLFLLVSVSSSMDLHYMNTLLVLILSFVLAKEFLRWKLDPFASPAILWVLHLALFWLPAGFLLWGVCNVIEIVSGVDLYFIGYHFVLLGFLTTVLIGFGTRVILGHSGNVPHADNVSVVLFVLVQVTLLIRALYSFNVAYGWEMDFLFDIASLCWIILFGVWGLKFGKVLVTR